MSNDLPPMKPDDLEVKVTALLLGELPENEAALMRELIARDADLARLQERLKLTLELLRETTATPEPAAAAPMKLSPERREKLLAHFKTVAPKEFARPERRLVSWPVAIAVAAAVVLLVMVTTPNYVRSRTTSAQNAIVNNLRLIDSSKQQWALEQRKSATDVPTATDLEPYLGRGEKNELPSSVAGETYSLGAVGQPPVARVRDRNGKERIITLPGQEQNLASLSPTAPAPEPMIAASGRIPQGKAAPVNLPQAATAMPPTAFGGRNLARAEGRGGPAQMMPLAGASPPGESTLASKDVAPAAGDTRSGRVGGLTTADLSQQTEVARSAFQDNIQNRREAEKTPTAPVAIVLPAQPAASEPAQAPPTTAAAPIQYAKSEDIAPALRQLDELKKNNENQQSLGVARTEGALFDAAQKEKSQGDQAVDTLSRNAPNSFGGGAVAGALVPATNPGEVNGQFKSQNNAFVGRYAYDVPPTQEVYSLNAVGIIASTPDERNWIEGKKAPNLSNFYGDKGSVQSSIISDDSKLNAQVDKADAPLPQTALPVPVPQPEVLTSANTFSTFSLNVSDAAFKLAQASLQNNLMPAAASIRSEEFINAFDYRDPEPVSGAPIGFAWERAAYPFAHNRDLLRFSVKTAAQGRQNGRPLNLVLLLDKSGSMERADRVEIIHQALRVLASQLQPQDTLSVVVFARTARLWADGVPGNQAGDVANGMNGLTPEGGTNLEEAMRLAYATALRHYLANGENRVVLLTDGAANLGSVDPELLKQKVEANRKQGIALDCFGVGWDGYNDNMMETLSRAGNGRYGFINTPEEAATEFAGKLAGALHVAASDVKVQVEFNPNRITAYRQIGYAKHQLTKEQFRDNSVAAAQIGAAESGTALYTVQVNPLGDGPLCTVRVRFRVPGTADYQEHAWDVPYTGTALALDQASPAMRLAATSAAFAEWLSGSPFAGEVTPDRLLAYLRGVPEVYGADARPKQLEWMIRQAKSISGK